MPPTMHDVFKRAFADTLRDAGRWLVRIEMAVLTGVGLVLLWAVLGWQAMKDELWMTGLCLFAPSVVSILFLFTWNLMRAPVRLRDAQFDKMLDAVQAIGANVENILEKLNATSKLATLGSEAYQALEYRKWKECVLYLKSLIPPKPDKQLKEAYRLAAISTEVEHKSAPNLVISEYCGKVEDIINKSIQLKLDDLIGYSINDRMRTRERVERSAALQLSDHELLWLCTNARMEEMQIALRSADDILERRYVRHLEFSNPDA